MKKIMAFDLGTRTGWCFDGQNHGVKDCKKKKGETQGRVYLKFHAFVKNLLVEHRPSAVYYEDVKNHVGVLAAHMYGGYKANLLMICDVLEIPCYGVGVGQIKKHATGKGNATKPMMINAAIDLGFDPLDDNDADAICLWKYANDANKV